MSTNHYNFLNPNIHSNDCTNYNTHNLITLTRLIWMSMIILYHYWLIETGKMFWSNSTNFWRHGREYECSLLQSCTHIYLQIIIWWTWWKSNHCILFQRKYWEPETGSIWSLINYYTSNPNLYPIFWYIKHAWYEHDCTAISREKTQNNSSNILLNIYHLTTSPT